MRQVKINLIYSIYHDNSHTTPTLYTGAKQRFCNKPSRSYVYLLLKYVFMKGYIGYTDYIFILREYE